VINLGQSLGIHVVAEGIESMAQAERLQRLGCDFGQGFLFSKAVPASRVRTFVDDLVRGGAWRRPSGEGNGLRLVASPR
jgi:EAL domain-containing protein (putative c-di-GMP-specific phosphodiesterase class I)